ncbi:MAG: hypothetical protein LBB36_03785 [Fibromonadaceae bacterium]|jgi:hypothetical protein|nr:hypothetical protein [Fibromonadaceae bacterium]
MNKIFVSCLLAVGIGFAQNPWDIPATSAEETGSHAASSEEVPSYEPPPPPRPPKPAPVQKASAVPEGKTAFDVLRGHAYNPYANVGAASNVGDLITFPSDIDGNKFFYVSPTEYLGYTAFGLAGGSVLLGLDNSKGGNLSALILGYATPVFGVALDYSISKEWESAKKYSQRTTNPGDNIGIYFSMPFGLYANASWFTYQTSSSTDNDGDVTKVDYSDIEINAGFRGNLSTLSYDAHLNLFRTGGSITAPNGDKFVQPGTYSAVTLGFDLGYTALQNDEARVIVGLNDRLGMVFYDKAGDTYKGDNDMLIILQPNILGEVVLFENWLAFAGASHSLQFWFGDQDADSQTHRTQIYHDNGTDAFVGMRYQKTKWALEAQVSANPFAAFAGNNILANIGGFIHF